MAKKLGVNRDVAEVFLSEIARKGSVRKACLVAGVTRSWLRMKLVDGSDFAERYADATEDSVDRLEEQAFAEAMDGSEKLLTYLLDAKRNKKSDAGIGSGVQPVITVTIGGSQ